MHSYFTKKNIFIGIIAIVIIGGGYLYFKKGTESPYETTIAERSTVSQEVSVTGKVKPAQSVDLAFEKGGRVAHVYAEVGQRAFTGQTLISLESGDVYASLSQAEANLQSAEAKLAELKVGTRIEEVAVQEAKVASAVSILSDAKQSLANTLQDSFTKADDAIHNKVDGLFSNPRTTSPTLNLTSIDSQLKTAIETERLAMESVLTLWASRIAITEASVVRVNLSQAKVLLDDIASAVNSLSSSSSISQTTIDGYKADVSTARTNINTAISSVISAEQTVTTAEFALVSAQKQLDLQKAGATAEQVAAQEAAVRSAEAQVANYQAQLAKTLIRAPISGVVTKQDARVGEIVGAGVVVASLITEGRFEIEGFIPEADIAHVALGNKATFTLDAYSDEEMFEAEVFRIDPAETIIDGVATYKTTLILDEVDERVRPGMTANLDIETGRVEGVISIPARAITREGDE